MKIWFDPSPEQVEDICAESEQNAAKWIRANGWMIFWKPEDAQHAEIARMVHADTYEKGLAMPGRRAD